jgi:RNA polymerase sigma factor (sigma-70 family)
LTAAAPEPIKPPHAQPSDTRPSSNPRDADLLERLRSGDAEALEHLMDRYDPVVRYAVFRVTRKQCLADPTWLDSVASEVWTGLCDSLHRTETTPTSFKPYLLQIARNRAISALRRDTRIRKHQSTLSPADEQLVEASPDNDPADMLGRVEELSALKQCLNDLAPEDRDLISQLPAITERRWVEAAQALGLAESTLRSRWNNVLKRLKACVESRTGREFAPGPESGD